LTWPQAIYRALGFPDPDVYGRHDAFRWLTEQDVGRPGRRRGAPAHQVVARRVLEVEPVVLQDVAGLGQALVALSGKDLGHFSGKVADQAVLPGWVARVERKRESIQVILQRDAAIDMMLAAIETYRVRQAHKKKTYAEMYGLCIGHIGRSGMDVQVNVERFVPQLRAVGDHESVEPNEKARREHIRLLGSLLPEKRVVGECHTHPYSTFQEMINIQGGAWGPSKTDLRYSKTSIVVGLSHVIRRRSQ
jgi:hypothetical protein